MFQLLFIGLVLGSVSIGCDYAFRTLKFPGIANAAQREDEAQEEQKQRERYRTKNDHAAFKWLLSNRIQQSMSLGDVNRILGEDGQRIYDDARLKMRNASSQLTDDSYRWGGEGDVPVYVLFFRNDRLVNFDPIAYRDAERSFD